MAEGGKKEFSIQMEDRIAKIEVDADELFAFGKRIGRNMVSAVESIGKVALGKVEVSFEYYDFTGNKETVSFFMNENEFLSLKKTLGK